MTNLQTTLAEYEAAHAIWFSTSIYASKEKKDEVDNRLIKKNFLITGSLISNRKIAGSGAKYYLAHLFYTRGNKGNQILVVNSLFPSRLIFRGNMIY